MKNIVLIGMSGSGKTTLGKALSENLSMDLIDTDQKIEEELGLTIPDIFKKYGESYFRNLEKKMIREVSLLKNKIISTGGGVILDKNNIISLKKNGIIFFIKRDIDNIIKSLNELEVLNRPLLENNINKLHNIYNDRINLYNNNADKIINNNLTLEDSLNEIKKFLS